VVVEDLVETDKQFTNRFTLVKTGGIHGEKGLLNRVDSYIGFGGPGNEGWFTANVKGEGYIAIYGKLISIRTCNRDMYENLD